jgi:hypothetical protein
MIAVLRHVINQCADDAVMSKLPSFLLPGWVDDDVERCRRTVLYVVQKVTFY